jgi:hypothetical protein
LSVKADIEVKAGTEVKEVIAVTAVMKIGPQRAFADRRAE